ncbi:hypothetical protein [Streptomyces spiramenti]|uniref:Uncharacterized protein n=1 Tax=Streptomyces spiramenti TaxID=2720606 RepID=A0ABX1AJC0_9ACTN|nr:hypothetical protein [Streptomyces spiramenti]NJP65488.1 hypothetical protein [Streptomyces spiramenti]
MNGRRVVLLPGVILLLAGVAGVVLGATGASRTVVLLVGAGVAVAMGGAAVLWRRSRSGDWTGTTYPLPRAVRLIARFNRGLFTVLTLVWAVLLVWAAVGGDAPLSVLWTVGQLALAAQLAALNHTLLRRDARARDAVDSTANGGERQRDDATVEGRTAPGGDAAPE